MPQNAASDQGLHCLNLIEEFLFINVKPDTFLLEMDQSKELR